MSELAAAELLASAPRMSILDAIYTKPKSVYAISRDIKLQPTAVRFHLQKLVEAGRPDSRACLGDICLCVRTDPRRREWITIGTGMGGEKRLQSTFVRKGFDRRILTGAVLVAIVMGEPLPTTSLAQTGLARLLN